MELEGGVRDVLFIWVMLAVVCAALFDASDRAVLEHLKPTKLPFSHFLGGFAVSRLREHPLKFQIWHAFKMPNVSSYQD